MIEDNDFIVVVRLINGETLISVLNDEDDNYIELKYPLAIKNVRVVDESGTYTESTVMNPWCSLTDDKYYRLVKTTVLFCKKLHSIYVQKYIDIVNYYNREAEVKKNESGFYEEVTNTDDIEKFVDKLESILKGESTDNEPESFFVEGNNTIN